MTDVVVRSFTGEAIRPYIPALARLRMSVFREYPYLYDGTEAYEASYLEDYARSDTAVVVVAEHDGEVVGASTALPLRDHGEDLAAPFVSEGLDPTRVFYFGESVLLAPYRGRGLGHAFFDGREAFARSLGRFTHTAFCAVDRPVDHPMRPERYVPHDAFWTKRGYEKRPTLKASIAWKELTDVEERPHTLTFWLRAL